MSQQWQVPVTLDEKEQYLIVPAILMAQKETVGEKEMFNIIGKFGN
jgi:hypothetical protein